MAAGFLFERQRVKKGQIFDFDKMNIDGSRKIDSVVRTRRSGLTPAKDRAFISSDLNLAVPSCSFGRRDLLMAHNFPFPQSAKRIAGSE